MANNQIHNEFLAEISRMELEEVRLAQGLAKVGYTNINSNIEEFLKINNINRSSTIRLLNITYRGRNVIQVKLEHDKYNAHTEYS